MSEIRSVRARFEPTSRELENSKIYGLLAPGSSPGRANWNFALRKDRKINRDRTEGKGTCLATTSTCQCLPAQPAVACAQLNTHTPHIASEPLEQFLGAGVSTTACILAVWIIKARTHARVRTPRHPRHLCTHPQPTRAFDPWQKCCHMTDRAQGPFVLFCFVLFCFVLFCLSYNSRSCHAGSCPGRDFSGSG